MNIKIIQIIPLMGILFFLVPSIIFSDTRIIIPLRHAPDEVIHEVAKEPEAQKLLNKIEAFEKSPPSTFSQKMVKNKLFGYLRPSLSGFMSVYAGYIDYSGDNGVISFPRRHTKQEIYLAITPEINLVRVRGETVSHREYMPSAPTKLYKLEKKEDPAKKTSYWEVKEAQLPQNNHVDPLTVVLFTHPRNIIVAPGKYLTNPGIQMVIPSIYVVDNHEKEQTILKALEFKYLFERITTETKKPNETTVQKISTNI